MARDGGGGEKKGGVNWLGRGELARKGKQRGASLIQICKRNTCYTVLETF